MKVLAGDVGGTNARLAIVESTGDTLRILREARYPSGEFPGLAPIVLRFLEEHGVATDRACFGIAGPVDDETVIASNLPWEIHRGDLAHTIGIERVALINDFAAIGYGIEALQPDDVITLQAGDPVRHAPIALIGAGTGLGEGFLFWDGANYQVASSEGGHADFAAQDDCQIEVLRQLRDRYGHVSWERVLSGPGLADVYRALATIGVAEEGDEVRREMAVSDPAAVITRHGVARTDALCVETLAVFVQAFGAQAGNLALTVVARGGVYLAGGIAPRIADVLAEGAFMDAFRAKGRMRQLASDIPVHVVMNGAVGLLGAAVAATRIP